MGNSILSGNGIPFDLSGMLKPGGADDIFVAAIGSTFDNNGYVGGTPQTLIDVPAGRAVGDLLICCVSAWTGASSMADNLGNYTLLIGLSGNYQGVYGRIATGDSNDDYRMPAQAAGESGIVRAQIVAIRSLSGIPTYTQIDGRQGSGGTFQMAARTAVGAQTENLLTFAIFSGWDKGGSLSTPPYWLTTPNDIIQLGENIAYGYMQSIPSWWFSGWGWAFQPSATTTTSVEIAHYANWGIKVYETSWVSFYSA